MEQEVNYIPVVLDYSSDGLRVEELDMFIKSIEAFKVQVLEEYKGKDIRIFLLPSEMIEILFNSQQNSKVEE